jgi:uncharacterized protein (TIGR03437 family)
VEPRKESNFSYRLLRAIYPAFAGLDQVNVQLPASLKGSGSANVVFTVNGQAANPVTISIQ